MAVVSISVGSIDIELGDEDRSAKYLAKLAGKTIRNLVDILDETGTVPEDEADSDG